MRTYKIRRMAVMTLLGLVSGGGLLYAETGTGVKVICHYMTWFKYREGQNSKIEIAHWKWAGNKANHNPLKSYNSKTRDIYSRFYPRIGIYDSGDPLVMDYHLLTAKAAGISTMIIDWYMPESNSDRAFQRLLDRSEELNMQVAVCYEEKTCFPPWNKVTTRNQAVAKAVKDFSYMKKYFKRPGYWQRNGRPVVLVFGGWGDWEHGKKLFNAAEWDRILSSSGTSPRIVLQNFKPEYKNIKARFAWQGDRAYTKWYYKTGDALVKQGKYDFYIGSVCPGFDDRGTWGWNSKPRFEAYLGLENFDRYLTDFDDSGCKIIQVVTWNDFAEGTMVEPTVQFGNLYLNRLGEWSAKRNNKQFNKINTLLPYQWFFLAKSLKKDDPGIAEARKLLANDEYAAAAKLLNKLADENKIAIPPYISYNNEFKPYSQKAAVKAVVPVETKSKSQNSIRWKSDGFLKPGVDNNYILSGKNYGAVEELNRHRVNETLSLQVIAVSPNSAYTVQLMMFDSKGKFLGSMDLKKGSAPEVININMPGLAGKLKPGTVESSLKIWLEGNADSKIKFILK